MADGSARGSADLAFAAHTQAVGFWAMDIWNKWIETDTLEMAVEDKNADMIFNGVKWQKVYGLVSATIATCSRIGWTVRIASTLVTDKGRILHLDLDPPIVIWEEVTEALKRWRWRRVEQAFPQLIVGGSQCGGKVRAVYAALKSKRSPPDWSSSQRAAFKSVFASRQWTQARRLQAGLAEHGKCIL